VAQTTEQFTALCERLERAANALRDNGCFLQAVARRYYLVYTVATRAAAHCGITVTQRAQAGAVVQSSQFSHRAISDVVKALYTGRRSGNVGPGNHSGIIGARLGDREAARYADWLHRDRILADYGPTDTTEFFDAGQADERFQWANSIVHDLRALICTRS
jgi:hypothetical protein